MFLTQIPHFFKSLIFDLFFLPIRQVRSKSRRNTEKEGWLMKTKRNLFAVTTVVICCVVLACFSPSIQGVRKRYEIQPQVTVPAYGAEAARTLDAYERLMEYYIILAEKNLASVNSGINSINNRLTELSQRAARIEKALGIENSKNRKLQKNQHNAIDRKKQK